MIDPPGSREDALLISGGKINTTAYARALQRDQRGFISQHG
jgi:hypothetical protein